MQSMIPALTERQRFWLKHIQACAASGKSIAVYSAEHGIAARAMYGGKKVLVKKGMLPATRPVRFQRVQVVEASLSSQWRISLPNGVSVAFVGEADTRALTAILHSAASLE